MLRLNKRYERQLKAGKDPVKVEKLREAALAKLLRRYRFRKQTFVDLGDKRTGEVIRYGKSHLTVSLGIISADELNFLDYSEVKELPVSKWRFVGDFSATSVDPASISKLRSSTTDELNAGANIYTSWAAPDQIGSIAEAAASMGEISESLAGDSPGHWVLIGSV